MALTPDSIERLRTCHPDLRLIISEAAEAFDIRVLCGFRNKAEQDRAFLSGTSTLKWPDSKHNIILKDTKGEPLGTPAVDIAPYPLDWEDVRRFYFLAGYVLGIAKFYSVPLRYGGDWNGNFDLRDNKFNDLGHFELRY